MIAKLWAVLWRLSNRDKLPKLPRGMLASPYEIIRRDDRRIMTRYGARCPTGAKVAMKRARARDVDSLVLLLPHFQPRRAIMERLNKMIDRALVATQRHPHAQDLYEFDKAARRRDAGTAHRINAALQVIRVQADEAAHNAR